jgi:hypothetical protein
VTRGKRYVMQDDPERSVVEDDDRLPGRAAEGQEVRRALPGRRVRQIVSDRLREDLGRYGLKLVAAESVKRGVTDVSAQVAKLQAAKPEVTFLVLVPGPGAQALKERQKIGWSDTIMVSTGR